MKLLWQGYESGLEVHDKTKYSGNETRGDADDKIHQGRGHRWKQSGIRGDVRPLTHKERQVT